MTKHEVVASRGVGSCPRRAARPREGAHAPGRRAGTAPARAPWLRARFRRDQLGLIHGRPFADTYYVAVVDWDSFDLDALAVVVRSRGGGPDAERMIWAFEEALRVARLDPELLSYLLAALTCLLARADDCSPRDVLEAFFRRSIPDEEWRGRYLPLFA